MPHFSVTSKMPCLSWGIPSKYCITGSKLREKGKEKLTACSFCYTFSGPIAWKNSQKLLQENLDEYLEDPEKWVESMAIEIRKKNQLYFRFFHSGDLQSVQMLEKICEVCLKSSDTKFWLPTQERKMVADFIKKGCEIPENLNIRVSAALVDKPEKSSLKNITFSMISLERVKGLECPARFQNGNCELCRACWDKTVETVSYPLKVGHTYRPDKYKK